MNRGRLFAVLGELVISLGDVLGDKEERSIGKSLFVHGLESGSSSGGLFKADESRVLGLVALDVSRLNFSVRSEHSG